MEKKSIVIFILCFIVGVGIFLMIFFYPFKISNNKIDELEIVNGDTKIRITAYSEKFVFVPGAYYVFESLDKVDNVNKIMTFRHDDPIPIKKNSINFINKDIIFVFMGWKYAVTRNGGYTWSVWDAENELQNWECCPYNLIQNIKLSDQGYGIMKLNHKTKYGIELLYTCDFGVSWNPKKLKCQN